ncbi:hypothetical protein F511_43584 [Dorcoceras hygrometricum]|uniref:Uncharacterized protein n=1 Tax=Dorcoceras hygrometricum TaxID=472368 RepID=A0A2Z7AGW8_9LAMI|nr:hypothetical protein F511_43584 [Dorcoceras hygrometricum]
MESRILSWTGLVLSTAVYREVPLSLRNRSEPGTSASKRGVSHDKRNCPFLHDKRNCGPTTDEEDYASVAGSNNTWTNSTQSSN